MRAINASFLSFLVLMGCCCPLMNTPNPTPAAGGPKTEEGGNKTPQGDVFASIQQAVKEGRTTDVDITGFPAKNYPYRDVSPEGGLLIGMQASLESNFGKPIIKALRPIYRTKNGEMMGPWIGKANPTNPLTTKAPDGYVVGSIDIRAVVFIEGFALHFVKLQGNRVDLNDTKRGEWLGGQVGNITKKIGGAGVLSVGICGYRGQTHEPCALGLIAANLQ